MNTSFTRLLWKEYRAQRMLWIVLLLGWPGLHLIFMFNEVSVLDAAPVIMMMPVCFLVAAAAIAFAGEEDDKTSNLMRMMPCRTSSLMSAKFTAIVTGCVTLCVSLLVLTISLELIVSVGRYVIGQSSQFVFPAVPPNQLDGTTWQDGESLYFPAFLALVFASGVFASMMTRGIFSAVGTTVVMFLGIMIAAFSMTSGIHQQQSGAIAPWISGVAAILMVISTVFLSRPWHLGRLPRRWTMPEAAGNFADRRIPSFSGLWHSWLRRIVAQPMTTMRVMTMLTWRECRSAVPFALTWLTIGVVICAGRYYSNPVYPWPFLFLFLFIHECGQRMMREDQRSGSITLLANIGVHPLQIWLSKTFSWLLVMCIVGFAVVKVDALVPTGGTTYPFSGVRFRILDVVNAIRVPGWDRTILLTDAPSTPADHWLQAGVCLAAALGLFSLGQLTACWIRRQVVAFAASFVIAIAGAVLLNRVLYNDWPIWIALVPIPFCFLLATARTSRQWIDRSITWQLRIRQMVWLVAPCILFPWLGQYVWQIQPAIALDALRREPGNAVSSVDSLENPGDSPEITQLSALARLPWAEWHSLDNPEHAKCWSEFAAAVEKSPVASLLDARYGYGRRTTSLQMQQLNSFSNLNDVKVEPEEILKPFDAFLSTHNAFPILPVMWTAPRFRTPAIALTAVLLKDARNREADGDVAGAAQQIVLAIRSNRSLAMQTASWANWLVCLHAERVSLGRLRLLLGTADLSSIELDELFSELKSALVMTQHDGTVVVHSQAPTMMLQRRTLFWTAGIESKGAFLEKHRSLPIRQRGFDFTNDSSLPLKNDFKDLDRWQLVRSVPVMMFSEALLNEKYRNTTMEGRVRCFRDIQPERIKQLMRFLATSSIVLPDLEIDVMVAEYDYSMNYVSIQHIDTIASERATLLTIMLQQYRIAHGKFPASLLDLPDGDRINSLIQTDPWTGAPFFYAAAVHKPSLMLSNTVTSPRVTSAQPLLCSAGSSGLSLDSYFTEPFGNDPIDMYSLPPNVVLFLGLTDEVDWRFRQIATSVTVFPEPVAESPVPLPPR